MFEAALGTIQPNFPPGILQGDPKYSNTYFNMSSGNDFRGPWNQGESTQLGESFRYVEDPIQFVLQSNSLLNVERQGTSRTEDAVDKIARGLGTERSKEVINATPKGAQAWNDPKMEQKNANAAISRNDGFQPVDASVTASETSVMDRSGGSDSPSAA